MTVEITFALVTAGFLALLVFGATTAASHFLLGHSPSLKATAGLGLAAGLWRVIHVLRRFDRARALGR